MRYRQSTGSETPAASTAIEWWLWLVALLVLVMVAVGGATRLTGSGLSITEWQPVLGAIPPLTDAAWQDAFAKYKLIPQYAGINRGMQLDAFKSIFWWEWGHRFLGRLIGLVFALPLAWFWWRGKIDTKLGRWFVALLALGGLQGGMGWFMVMSGLSERTSVSQYRLATHLGLALLLLGALVWTALELAHRRMPPRSPRLTTLSASQRRSAFWLTAVVFVQILLGALVAGLRAGLTYNTWPLMDGSLVPPGLFMMSPWYLNFFENITTVQFNHRLMAYVVLCFTAAHAWSLQRVSDDGWVSGSAWTLLAAVAAQAALGIWTLVAVVPLHLGIAHQAGAAIVLCIAVWHLSWVRRA
jgi:heme a synthase